MNRGAIRAAFAQFAALGQNAIDNKAYLTKGKLTMPVLAIGGETSGIISEMEQLPYGETGAVRINDWRVLQME